MRIIYKALLSSFLIVIVTGFAAWLVADWISKSAVTTTSQMVSWLQYGGIGILLWATLAKQGWNIQTYGGQSTAEKVDQWIFRGLYVVGSFCFYLSVMVTPVKSSNAEQGGGGQSATSLASK